MKRKLEPRFRVIFSRDIDPKLKDWNEDSEWYTPFWCLVEHNHLDEQIRIVGSDGGEPEDQNLVRNWKWVVDEMNDLDKRNRRLEKRIIALKDTLDVIRNGEGPIDEVIDQALIDDGKIRR